MSPAVRVLDRTSPNDVSDGLQQLATLPDWLIAAVQPDRVIEALARVPEFASGETNWPGSARSFWQNTRGSRRSHGRASPCGRLWTSSSTPSMHGQRLSCRGRTMIC
jgi:hypothetical protein